MDGTSTVEVVIATATAAANGQNVGDISIIIPEGLANSLTSSAEAAADACSAVLLRKRDNDDWRRQTDTGKTADALSIKSIEEIKLTYSSTSLCCQFGHSGCSRGRVN
jgi:hypothetical protein